MPAIVFPGRFMAGILLLFTGCHSPVVSGGQKSTATAMGIQVIRHYPVLNNAGGQVTLHSLDDTLTIISDGEFVLYRLPPVRVFETNAGISGTERYFLHRQADTTGILFTAKDRQNKTSMAVDSFVNRYALGTMVMDVGVLDSLVAAKYAEGEPEFTEMYIPRKAAPAGYFDSLYLVFDKRLYGKVTFSFSPKLDSSRSAKLTHIRLIYKAGYSIPGQPELPAREYVFAIKELPDAILKKYLPLTERWNEDQ